MGQNAMDLPNISCTVVINYFSVKHMIAYPYVLPKSLDSIVKALALPAIASTQFKYYSMAYKDAYTF